MAWIDQTYLTNAIGAAQVTALGLTDASARLIQYELLARSRVIAALQYAGYADPGDTLTETTEAQKVTAAFYKQMAAAVLLRDAFALIPGIDISQAAQAAIGSGLALIDAVYEKKLPIPGATANTLDGYGGSQFNNDPTYTSSGSSVTTPIFRALRGSTF